MPVFLKPDAEATFSFNSVYEGSKAITNYYTPAVHPSGRALTITFPGLTGASSGSLSSVNVEVSNSRTHIQYTSNANLVYGVAYDKYNTPQAASGFNITASNITMTFVNIRPECTVGNGYIVVPWAWRHIRLTALSSTTVIQSLSAFPFAYIFHEGLTLGS